MTASFERASQISIDSFCCSGFDKRICATYSNNGFVWLSRVWLRNFAESTATRQKAFGSRWVFLERWKMKLFFSRKRNSSLFFKPEGSNNDRRKRLTAPWIVFHVFLFVCYFVRSSKRKTNTDVWLNVKTRISEGQLEDITMRLANSRQSSLFAQFVSLLSSTSNNFYSELKYFISRKEFLTRVLENKLIILCPFLRAMTFHSNCTDLRFMLNNFNLQHLVFPCSMTKWNIEVRRSTILFSHLVDLTTKKTKPKIFFLSTKFSPWWNFTVSTSERLRRELIGNWALKNKNIFIVLNKIFAFTVRENRLFLDLRQKLQKSRNRFPIVRRQTQKPEKEKSSEKLFSYFLGWTNFVPLGFCCVVQHFCFVFAISLS